MFIYSSSESMFILDIRNRLDLVSISAYHIVYQDYYKEIKENRNSHRIQTSNKIKIQLNKSLCKLLKKRRDEIRLIRDRIKNGNVTIKYNVNLSDGNISIDDFLDMVPDFNRLINTIDVTLEIQEVKIYGFLYMLEANNYQTFDKTTFLSNNCRINTNPYTYVFFDDLCLDADDQINQPCVRHTKTTPNEKIFKLLDVIAYFRGCPLFAYSENKYWNEKIDNLYKLFDLTEMLYASKTIKRKKKIHLNDPIIPPSFKEDIDNDIIIISSNTINHPKLLQLYHDSLRQLEPLPRCLFLYRILEYAINIKVINNRPFYEDEYDKYIKENNLSAKKERKTENYLNFFYKKALEHKYYPLYYLCYGYIDSDNKESYQDLIKNLVRQSKIILNKWNTKSQQEYSTVFYDNIIKTGRNAVAHGEYKDNESLPIATYTDISTYSHINDVNIILELIARYIVETMNPDLLSLVDDQKPVYKKQEPTIINI